MNTDKKGDSMKRLLLILQLFMLPVSATIIVPIRNPDGSTFQSFPQPISAKVFDIATGTFFLGLSSGFPPFTVSSGNRANFGNNSKITGIATQPPLNENDGIEFLTLATSIGNTKPNLGIVIQLPTGPEHANVVVASNATGKIVTRSPLLNDASGAINVNGLRTSGIVGLAASQFFMFPAVKPCGGNFGADCNGGIASVSINQSTLALSQVPAVPLDGGIKAQKLDPTTPAVFINNSPDIVPNEVDLYWDDQLQRLYIGIQMTTAGLSSVGATCATGTGTCNTAPLPTCPTGLFIDPATLNCITCPSGGFYNSNSQQCQLCPTGQLFSTTSYTCVTATCPFGQFFNPVTLVCVTCPSGWYFNQNTLSCVTCGNSQFYDPNISGCTACPAGFVFDPIQGFCITGPISCVPPQVPYQGICVTPPSCPDGFTADGLTCITAPSEPFPPQPPFVGDPTFLSHPRIENNLIHAFVGPNGLIEESSTRIIQMATRAVASGGRSVIVAQVDTNGQITFDPIAPDSAFMIGNTQNIVGILDILQRDLAINKVRVLHASTGPSYLIVNGVSNDDITQVRGNIYALPLVDLNDSTNPLQGTLADKNSALVDFKFVTPATANSQMPLDNENPVVVGTGPVALPASDLISDINVVGDTVYISINATPSGSTEGGILYSQALFDETGKIKDWTPWTKKAFPPYTTSTQTNAIGVSGFAVDAVNSKVWAIDSTGTTVLETGWANTKSTATKPDSSLLGQLNANFTGAVTAILDLDQSTRGFLSNQSRYALFAGDSNNNTEIIFARISQSLGNQINSPQTVITDFTLSSNFMVSALPNGCQVQTLEYARQQTGSATNYFFAGTQNGLYVFSDSGNGFDVSSMGNLSAPPFSNGSWTLVPNISGSVADIKTSGNTLYVITQTPATSATNPMQSTVYRIAFAPTVSAMFAPSNIITIAQTGTGIFANIVLFNELAIIATNTVGSTEQVVLATNNGLYQSTRPGGVQAAIDQTDAGWLLLANTAYFYNGIASIDNASIPFSPSTTVWPFHIGDLDNFNTDDGGVLQQLNGTTDSGPYQFIPAFFDSIDSQTNPIFTTLPLFSYFWSDGARRIMTVDNIGSSCAPEDLLSLPFDTIAWNVKNIDKSLIDDPILNKGIAYYWVKQIGMSGLLITGTDNGVMALG